MTGLLQSLMPQMLLLGLVLTRLVGMLTVAPVFAGRNVPARIKAGLAILTGYVALGPVAAVSGPVPTDPLAYALLMGKEALIGIAFGLIVQFLFSAVQTAGFLIDSGSGLAVAQVLDPTSGATMAPLGRFYNLIALTVFVIIGGPIFLIAGIVRSFSLISPTEMPSFTIISGGLVEAAVAVFAIAVALCAPLMLALLITDIALGVMSRAVPQMNVFIVSLPLKIGIALVGLAVLLPAFVGLFDTYVSDVFVTLSKLMRTAG